TVFVENAYQKGATGDVLLNAIKSALAYAQAHNFQHVVFQGGLQGEHFLNSTIPGISVQSDLENLFTANADNALFAVASGNGGVNLSDTSPPQPDLGGGVARLAANHMNIISVGAVRHTPSMVPGVDNTG